MSKGCPHCKSTPSSIVRNGYYVRKSDSKKIKRFKCKSCYKRFSSATFSSCYNQNKRRLNPVIRNCLCSSMSMRRVAKIYKISRTTVKRKLEFLASQARLSQQEWLKERRFSHIQFDDLETIEHTKFKPITVTLAVEQGTRKVIGFCVARIPAKGLLAAPSRRKYGRRRDESRKKREEFFKNLKPHLFKGGLVESDESVFYLKPVRKFLPDCKHIRYKGKRGCIRGQGELKSGGYDPLFSINHTFAMLRANINRLVRKSWCTTKKLEALEDHIALYIDFHNKVLTS